MHCGNVCPSKCVKACRKGQISDLTVSQVLKGGDWRVFCLHLRLLLLMLTLANNQEDPSGAKGQEGQTAGLDAHA